MLLRQEHFVFNSTATMLLLFKYCVQGIHIGFLSPVLGANHSVKMYDSMTTGDVSVDAKESIATLLNCSSRFIMMLFPEVQQQSDGSSCGLFALAFAYTLCEGRDPSGITYLTSKFREHFLRCLHAKEITAFQTEK